MKPVGEKHAGASHQCTIHNLCTHARTHTTHTTPHTTAAHDTRHTWCTGMPGRPRTNTQHTNTDTQHTNTRRTITIMCKSRWQPASVLEGPSASHTPHTTHLAALHLLHLPVNQQRQSPCPLPPGEDPADLLLLSHDPRLPDPDL